MEREMLGDELCDALQHTRGRLGDATVALRIEEYDHKPGRHVVARGGADLQHGMSHQGALDYLAGLV